MLQRIMTKEEIEQMMVNARYSCLTHGVPYTRELEAALANIVQGHSMEVYILKLRIALLEGEVKKLKKEG